MNEFNILTAARQHIQDHLGTVKVYFATDPKMDYPCCLLEIDEIWSQIGVPERDIQSLVKFSLSYMTKDTGVHDVLSKSEQLTRLMDGQCFRLSDNSIALLRLETSQAEIAKEDKLKKISQHYEAIIRGGCDD